MSFSQWSIRNPIPPIVLFLMLTITGVYSYQAMTVSNMPTITIPLISVSVNQVGASPEEMESQITNKVESAVSSIAGIKHVNSKISMGSSVTTIEFSLDIDVDRAFIDVRSAMANIRADLPANIDEPLVQRIDIDGGAVTIYTVTAPESTLEELSYYIDETLSRQLMSIQGVAQVTRLGGADNEISIELDADKLASFGTSAVEISRQLAKVQVNRPGGNITVNDTTFRLRTLAGKGSLDELKTLSIPLNNGRYLQLGHMAIITEKNAELSTLSRLNGKPTVSFSVFRTKGASEVQVVQDVEQTVMQISRDNPHLQFQQIFSLAKFTKETFNTAVLSFWEGTFLTIIIIFIFLRDLRSTIIAAVTIPLSVIPTFFIMHWLGFNINSISMLAIAMVIGVLVDDAIVEIENVHRHMGLGKRPYDAAILAVEEIGLAVIATTAVICVIFLPVAFMPGIPGLFFKQFGLTVVISAFFSLLVARLITPMLCAYLLKSKEQKVEKKPGRILLFYSTLITWSLRHRFVTVSMALACLLASFALLPFLSLGYTSQEDYSYSVLKLELPYGSTLEQTDAVAMQLFHKLKTFEEVEFVLTTVNGGTFGSEGAQQASIEIKLIPPDQRKVTQQAFEHIALNALKDIPDVKMSFSDIQGSKPVSFALVSDDLDALYDAAKSVQTEMRQLSGLNNVTSSIEQRQPEVIIQPRYTLAAQLGITSEQINEAILTATMGDTNSLLAKFNKGTQQIPIRVLLPKQSYSDIDVLRNLIVYSSTGQPVSLATIADFSITSGPNSIERYARQRMISLSANLNNYALGDAMNDIMALPAITHLPENVNVRQFGEAEFMNEMNRGFMLAIMAGLTLVYFVQVLLYKDWIQPVTRMMALPLSVGGAFLLLIVTGTELNMSAIIGMLMLMAIADKNSILLVDYMLERIKSGVVKNEAIIEGCIIRARPIVMTSFAMLASMLPIVFGIGQQSVFRVPMAVAVIGGIVSSTVLSLIFIPVFFSYVHDFKNWLFPKLKKIIS